MKNNNPKISVLMSVYNEEELWLREAIESILNQSFTDFEFIIILDKPDNDLAKKVIKEYQKQDQRIVFLENEKNIGLVKSLNKGIKISRGKYIARMDADDISLKDRLTEQVKFLDKNPEISLLGSWFHKINEKGEVIRLEKYSDNPQLLKNLVKFRCPIHHPTWLIKKEVYEKVGGYQNALLAEDYNLILRSIESGFLISNIKKPLLKYRISRGQVSQKKSLIQIKSTIYLFKMHKQRLKTGKDNFSEENLNKVIKSSKLETYFYHKADNLYIKARELKDKKRYFLALPLIIASFCLSPYWMSRRFYRAFFGLEKVQNFYLKKNK